MSTDEKLDQLIMMVRNLEEKPTHSDEARLRALEQEVAQLRIRLDELERVQNQHSIDIMKLRAAI